MRMLAKSGALWALAAAFGAVGACADGEEAGPQRPGLEIQVAPLTLSGLTDACYRLKVMANAGTVWEETDICASQYGFGTEISYVGTCDATDVDETTEGVQAPHIVELELLGLCERASPAGANDNCPQSNGGTGLGAVVSTAEYVNPCGGSNPVCRIVNVPCAENADTPVTFNLTVMRDANQGFFDIAVNFEDIFCSAKVDCRPELLHNPSLPDSPRDATAIVAFACTNGQSTADSSVELYASDLTLTCGTRQTTFALASTLDGNQPTPAGSSDTFGWAIYKGVEQLSGYAKGYWNVAIGLLPGADDCVLEGTLTATENGGLPGAAGDNELVSYPIVNINVPVVAGDADSPSICREYRLNEPDETTSPWQGIWTTYDTDGDLTDNGFANCVEAVSAGGSFALSTDCTENDPVAAAPPPGPEDEFDVTILTVFDPLQTMDGLPDQVGEWDFLGNRWDGIWVVVQEATTGKIIGLSSEPGFGGGYTRNVFQCGAEVLEVGVAYRLTLMSHPADFPGTMAGGCDAINQGIIDANRLTYDEIVATPDEP